MAKRKKKWMQKAFGEHPGALHEHYGLANHQKIPIAWLKRDQAKLRKKKNRTKKETKLLRRINAALTAISITKKRKK